MEEIIIIINKNDTKTKHSRKKSALMTHAVGKRYWVPYGSQLMVLMVVEY